MAIDHSTIIEGFVIDDAFVDRSKTINGIFVDESGKVASLTPKALSYFNKPSVFKDKRAPNSRAVNWFAETNPSLIVDKEVYSTFVAAINNLTAPISNGFFKLVDKLLFNYNSVTTHQALEALLVNDADIAAIYVPNSFTLSATIVDGDLFYQDGTEATANVPAFAKFSISVPSGSSTNTYVLTLFTSVEAWLTGYDVSTVVKVVPPLSFERLYNASLVNAVDNILNTASMTAVLSYNTTQAVLGTVSISGITEYNAVLVDSAGNTASVPFNVIYKGRKPTLSEIREAIRYDLLHSGIGNLAGWEARIPGVFVAGRFYIVPYWDMSYTKPDQIIYPSIVDYKTLGVKVNKILDSAGFGDITQYTDIMPVYYNRMTTAAVPDLTGVVDIKPLSFVIPDYQNFSPDEENFAYMTVETQEFAKQLNVILAIDAGGTDPGIYIPITENLITFRSFVIGKYEVCVVTKLSYTTIMESEQ